MLYWALFVIAVYLLISLITTIWYVAYPGIIPNKKIELICYPIGLLIVLYFALRGRRE